MNPLTEEREKLAAARIRAAENRIRLSRAKRELRECFTESLKSPTFVLTAFTVGVLAGSGSGSASGSQAGAGARASGRPGLFSKLQKMAFAGVSLLRLRDAAAKRFTADTPHGDPVGAEGSAEVGLEGVVDESHH